MRDLENRNLFIPFVQIIETNGREQKGTDSDTMNTRVLSGWPSSKRLTQRSVCYVRGRMYLLLETY